MSGWTGYQQDILRAAGLSTDGEHVVFILDWNFHASSDCTNNPVDISRKVRGAHDCHRLTASRVAQRYDTRREAESAFAGQLQSGQFPHLLAALKAPKPYEVKDPASVVSDLNKWGSGKFAAYYADQSGVNPPDKPPTVALPKGHSGYGAFAKAMARTLPTNLHRSKVIRGRVLRKMGAPRNVR